MPTDRLDEIAQWRRHFHQNPELMYAVEKTAKFVADKLRAFGCDEVVEGIGRTGVVGVVQGRGTSKRTVGLRADMDALPITETSGRPYASKTSGRMHACGHDGHTAMLLGAARELCERRDFDGRIALIFQPAEEGGAGGRAMIQDGLMDRFSIEQVYGMHNLPGLPLGQFGMNPGPIMAAADYLSIDIVGEGGHAALPHRCVDPMVAAAQIIMSLQTISARTTDPLDPVVVSITTLKSDSSAHNVIPNKVSLGGTVRSLKPDVRDATEQRIREIVSGIGTATGTQATLQYRRGYPPTINTAAENELAAIAARRVVGDAAVDAEHPPMMGAEDFSFMLNERPGAYIFIGNGDSAGLHSSSYDFDDNAIGYGVAYWVSLAATVLPVDQGLDAAA